MEIFNLQLLLICLLYSTCKHAKCFCVLKAGPSEDVIVNHCHSMICVVYQYFNGTRKSTRFFSNGDDYFGGILIPLRDTPAN